MHYHYLFASAKMPTKTVVGSLNLDDSQHCAGHTSTEEDSIAGGIVVTFRLWMTF